MRFVCVLICGVCLSFPVFSVFEDLLNQMDDIERRVNLFQPEEVEVEENEKLGMHPQTVDAFSNFGLLDEKKTQESVPRSQSDSALPPLKKRAWSSSRYEVAPEFVFDEDLLKELVQLSGLVAEDVKKFHENWQGEEREKASSHPQQPKMNWDEGKNQAKSLFFRLFYTARRVLGLRSNTSVRESWSLNQVGIKAYIDGLKETETEADEGNAALRARLQHLHTKASVSFVSWPPLDLNVWDKYVPWIHPFEEEELFPPFEEVIKGSAPLFGAAFSSFVWDIRTNLNATLPHVRALLGYGEIRDSDDDDVSDSEGE